MLKFIIILVVCVATSYGESTSAKPVACGPTPSNILECANAPDIVSPSLLSSCRHYGDTDCDVAGCAFRHNNWFARGELNKTNLISHFNQLAVDHPIWKDAFEYVVLTCVEPQLLTQGIYFNCVSYDALTCAEAALVQRAPASQWSTSAECSQSRVFASTCPICPSKCFEPHVPYNCCHICENVPKQTTI